jgi:hypothetical protein
MALSLLTVFDRHSMPESYDRLVANLDTPSLLNLCSSCRQFRSYKEHIWSPQRFLRHWIKKEEDRQKFWDALTEVDGYVSGGALLHFIERTPPGESDLDVFLMDESAVSKIARVLTAAGGELLKRIKPADRDRGSDTEEFDDDDSHEPGEVSDSSDSSDSSNSSEDSFDDINGSDDFVVKVSILPGFSPQVLLLNSLGVWLWHWEEDSALAEHAFKNS